jgi:steroid 5-alpha reductase family enzyme
MAGAALRARQLGVVAVVDVAWGLGFVVVAVATAVVASGVDGADARRWLVALLVAVWGLRLAWHVRRRAVDGGGREDPRYAEMLGGSLREVGMAAAVRRVFAVQGAAQWFVALPVAVGAALGTAWSWVAVVGVVVWLVGLVFEAVGDAQLRRYKARPREERPPVMDRGLWAWTRHPNYFGDACVWWGLWLVAALAAGWLPGLLTVLCPVVMTVFLRNVTGAKLLERTMSRREGWDEYAARVPMFVPRPPRR